MQGFPSPITAQTDHRLQPAGFQGGPGGSQRQRKGHFLSRKDPLQTQGQKGCGQGSHASGRETADAQVRGCVVHVQYRVRWMEWTEAASHWERRRVDGNGTAG